MKYMKISLMIMAICMTLTAVNSYALENGEVHFGMVVIDFWGSYKTALYRKQTNSPQYARVSSCKGVTSGLNIGSQARTDRYEVKEGDWTDLTDSNTQLLGKETKVVDALYELNLKDNNILERCNFVGSWTYN